MQPKLNRTDKSDIRISIWTADVANRFTVLTVTDDDEKTVARSRITGIEPGAGRREQGNKQKATPWVEEAKGSAGG